MSRESDERQINLQLEFVHTSVEEILEDKLNNKKRKAPHKESSHKVNEHDDIYIGDLNGSVGSYIKNEALKNYCSFSGLSIQDQTCVSLGMNSILDFSYKFGDGQLTLFTADQWLNLQSRFPVKGEEDSEINDNLLKLTDEFNSIMSSIIQSKSSFEKILKKLSSWLKRVEDQYKELNAEESYFVYLLKHLIKLYTKSSYIFNPDIDCSEWDYVIKIWAPIIEETDLRSKWGDTVCKTGNEDGITSLKIDLRIIIDKMIQRRNVENDVASGEFAKYDSANLKYQSERCKVMIEGKTVINNVISRGFEITYIPVLQICETELCFLVISLVAPGLYVGNEIPSFSLIDTIENFKILPVLTRSLLEFQSKCVNTSSLIDENIKTTERAKGSTKGPKYNNRQEAPVNNRKQWIRSNWVVFRGVKYTSSSVPAPPF